VSEEAAPRTGWRSWFASTGQPPAWALVRYMAAGLLAGVALSSPLPNFRGTLLGALAGLIVAAAGSGGPSLISRRVALITAALGLVLTAIAFATGGRPVWAAVAMAAVAVLTSLGAAAGPLGAVLGFLLSLAYLLVALMARTANLFELVSFRWAAAHIAVGCLAGLLVVLVGTAWRRRTEPEEVRTATAPPIPVRAMWASLKTYDEHARDEVRRAIPLAILMYCFQRNGGRDAFWIFFAAYLVLLTPGKEPEEPDGRPSRQRDLRRAPARRRVPHLSGPGALLARDRHPLCRDRAQPALPRVRRRPHDDRLRPAGRRAHRRDRRLGGRRVLDTAIGCAIALVATYLLWPQDDETDEQVPVTT
jgi:hypothetical protein